MKITNVEGDWIGLARWEEGPYQIDYFSTPDAWTIGFEIVYRLSFSGDALHLENNRLADGVRRTFKDAFGLSDSHYELSQWGGLSVYWRVNWDREGLNLKLLEKCEENLDRFAEANKIRVLVLEMTAIPRSLQQISKYVGLSNSS